MTHRLSSTMPVAKPLYALDAVQVLDLIKANAITVEEYAEALLNRVRDRNSTVKAWAYIDADFVLRQARVLDEIPHDQRGPLHGVAIGIKDVMNTKDMPTQFGSELYKGHQSCSDSAAVGILRAAGSLIFGKTTTTEFTVANSGPETTNPHDPNRTPGGSSCGSAAAVADLQIPLSLGVQTGGSVIRPASYTGLFAMKPTYSAVSNEGQKSFSITFDTIGFFARSIEDLQLIANVFSIKDDEPVKDTLLTDTSVALVKTPMWSQAGPGTVAALNKAATILENNGAKVVEISLPTEVGDEEALSRRQKVIFKAEAHAAFLREYRLDKTKIGPEIRRLVENSSDYTHSELTQALDKHASTRTIIDQMAANYSAIIAPSAIDEAPFGLDDMGSPAFNTLWTGFHVPVINIPAFTGAHGMPIGVSIVAGRFRDQHLLSIAKVLSEPLMTEGGWKVTGKL
ncbi:amidase signature domain-containing protein [Lophiotrema nucula]|uniref:Amidase signature domain-containing protein n=1 Tax=Lophiotrema nucula TaxID=690887 RepID=A0A6A5Z9V2_9PLEO|nr:amidase signature domain-containing protein [Lophiotrema nucula]